VGSRPVLDVFEPLALPSHLNKSFLTLSQVTPMLMAFPTAKLSTLETSSSVVSRVEAYVTAAH